MRYDFKLFFASLLLFLSSGETTFAQILCSDAENARLQSSFEEALQMMNGIDCFSQDKNEDNPIVSGYRSRSADAGPVIAERMQNFEAATEFLREHAQTMAGAAAADRDLWILFESALAEQARITALAKAADSPQAARELWRSAIDDDTWALQPNSGVVPGLQRRSVFLGLDSACADFAVANRAACPAYEDRKTLIIAVKLAQDLAGYNERGELYAQLQDSLIANKRWEAYFNEARFQWWWEVMINGRRMQKGDGCDQNGETQQRDGFCTVPNDQVIFMHPDVALSWIDGADASSDLGAAFVVEVYGRNKWEWDGAKMEKARGWSVIASYSDQVDDWGYGLMYHYRNRYSLAVTSTSGDVGVLLSMDFSDALFERKAKYKDYLQNLDKPSFWSEVFTKD